MKKQLLALGLGTVMAFGLVGCGEKTVATEEAYTKLNSALTNTLNENTKEFSLTAQSNIKVSAYTMDEETESDVLEEREMSVDFGFKYKVVAGSDIPELAVWIKVLPKENSSEVEDFAGLTLESYVTGGYIYTYSNLFEEDYGYEEVDSDFEGVDFSEVTEAMDEIKAFENLLPAPVATVKGGEYTLAWSVTNENLFDYIKMYFYIMGGSGDLDEEEMHEEFDEIVSRVQINECKFSVKVKDDKFSQFDMKVNVEQKPTEEDAMMSLNSVSTSLTIKASYSKIGAMFDETRLQEIKAGYEAQKEEEEEIE